MGKVTWPGLCFAIAIMLGAAVPPGAAQLLRNPDGGYVMGGQAFPSLEAYVNSAYFQANGLRCKTINTKQGPTPKGTQADCSLFTTVIAQEYDPQTVRYRIPVVVHVLMSSLGEGALTDEQIERQIEILNEDFRALPGSNGANGNDAQIEFYLADEDPDGQPATGITRTTNDAWFEDEGNYYDTLAWDTARYLNIYTNLASGALGYAYLPQFGVAGDTEDRVVILYEAFGDNPGFAPYGSGRTATHEVGHYLGLDHTFGAENECPNGAAPGCYSNGDLICDTNPEEFANYGCPDNAMSCGSADPITNYMDYTDDLCMMEFTPEQANRMRCSLVNWRPLLFEVVEESAPALIESNRPQGFIEEGQDLILTAPAGTGHVWLRNGNPVDPDPGRVEGVNTATLTFSPVALGDSGVYTCTFDDGSKAPAETAPFEVNVLPQGSLPIGSLAAALALLGVLAIALKRRDVLAAVRVHTRKRQ